MSDVRSVAERLESSTEDLSRAHDLCLEGMGRLAAKVLDAFPTPLHSAAEPFVDFASDDGAMRGSIRAYSGPSLDWAIHSWIGSPERGFTNHHLTIYLPPSIKVPHLGFAIGTIPHLFWFADLVPRTDLWVDTEAVDRYYEPFNEQFLAVTEDPRFSPFISKETYIRQAISPVGICKTAEPSPDNISDALSVFDRFLDTWIGWVRDAEPVPEDEQAALGERDRIIRKTICERDPANVVAERVLGKETTDQLVALLAGTVRSEK